jgi:class III poly(R)-hydroxyalkanoic acid synthase PhaE subunit
MREAEMSAGPFDAFSPGGAAAEAYVRFARALAEALAPSAGGGAATLEALRRFGAAQFGAAQVGTAEFGAAPFGPGVVDTPGAAPFAFWTAPLPGAAGLADAAAAFARGAGATPAGGAAAGAPPLGPNREHQLKWQAWLSAAQACVAAAQEFALVLGEIGATAGERYATRLAEPDATSAPLRVLFDDWIECAESAYQAAAHGERFCAAHARYANALVAWRAAQQAIADDAARALGVPTRTEVDELQRTVRELQRELASRRDASAPTAATTRKPRASAPRRRRRAPT